MYNIEDWNENKIKKTNISLKCIFIMNFIITLFIATSLITVYMTVLSPLISNLDSQINNLGKINNLVDNFETILNIICQNNTSIYCNNI